MQIGGTAQEDGPPLCVSQMTIGNMYRLSASFFFLHVRKSREEACMCLTSNPY